MIYFQKPSPFFFFILFYFLCYRFDPEAINWQGVTPSVGLAKDPLNKAPPIALIHKYNINGKDEGGCARRFFFQFNFFKRTLNSIYLKINSFWQNFAVKKTYKVKYLLYNIASKIYPFFMLGTSQSLLLLNHLF